MLINIPDCTTVCALMKFSETLGCQIRVVDGTVTLSEFSKPNQLDSEFCIPIRKPVLTMIGGARNDTNTNKPR